MLEEPIVFLVILILSLLAKNLLSYKSKEKLGLIYQILLRLGYIGVMVHEISHYIMSLAVGKIPKRIEIKWRDKRGNKNPHGSVNVTPPSFLQAIVICLAPLYISTWLIFLSLNIMIGPDFNPWLRIIAGFLFISLFIGAAPSYGDFLYIIDAFKKASLNSFYQLFLIFISGLILWMILWYTHVVFILDLFYYLAIAGIYLVLKFSIFSILTVSNLILSRDYKKPSKAKIGRFTRKHYKPKKPRAKW
ncbi:MAG: hypothetical protein ACFE9Q_11270 [Candidatus Hodarchaeota archaeon]